MIARPRDAYPVVALGALALSLIRYDRTALVLLLCFVAAAWRDVAAAARARPGLFAALAALMAWVAALALWRGDRLALQFLAIYAGYAAMFVAAGAIHARGRPAAADMKLLLGFLVAVSLLLLVPRGILHGDFLKVFRPDEIFAGRWTLIFNNPNVYGIVMATGFCLAVALWRLRTLPAPVLLAAGLLFLFQIAMSGSRNAVGVAGLGALAFAWFGLRDRGALAARALAVALVLAIAGAVAYLAATGRLTHPNQAHGFDSTLDVRLGAWRQALERIAAHPWTGIGTQAILTGQPHRHAHNAALTWAMEFGLVGTALAALFLFLALRRASLAALVPLIPALAGQAIDDFHFQRSFGLLAAMLLAGAAWARTDRAPPASA